MRLARLSDYRRRLHVRAGEWPLKLGHFAFSGILSLGSGELRFRSPFTVISGPNGVGKTTLLRAIWTCADPSNAAAVATRKLEAGTAVLSFENSGAPNTSEVIFAAGKVQGGTPLGVPVIHLDAASEILKHQEFFNEFATVEDLINGAGSKDLEGSDLASINYLAKRDYRTLQLYEVEAGGDVAPFFEVALGNDRYDSRTMGTGELAIFFLWWSVQRAAPNSLLLIEEPECYLSPGSQEAISHFLIQSAVDKHLTIVMTSHSSKIIASLADENLIFVYRNTAGANVVDGPPPPALLETIGITPSKDVILLVEDEAAATFGRLLLERFRPSLSRRTEIANRQGEGNIVKFLRDAGGKFQAVRFVGLFDGDMRDRIPADLQPHSTFLPGDATIESSFRTLIEADPGAVQMAIGSGDVNPILFRLQGAEQHDWFHEFCQQLGLNKSQLFPTLFQLWLRSEENTVAAKAVVQSIEALLSEDSAGNGD